MVRTHGIYMYINTSDGGKSRRGVHGVYMYHMKTSSVCVCVCVPVCVRLCLCVCVCVYACKNT